MRCRSPDVPPACFPARPSQLHMFQKSRRPGQQLIRRMWRTFTHVWSALAARCKVAAKDAGCGATSAPVDASAESVRCHRRQHAGITGPGDAEIFAAGPLCGGHPYGAKPGEWPIERAREPGHTLFFAGERGAAPLVRVVEQPDTRKAERRRDLRNLRHIRRARPGEPAARTPSTLAERCYRARKDRKAVIAQGTRRAQLAPRAESPAVTTSMTE